MVDRGCRRLQIAVDDERPMSVLDGVADDAEQAQACLEGEVLSAAPVGDGNPVHELHHEEGRAVGREAAVQQASDGGCLRDASTCRSVRKRSVA